MKYIWYEQTVPDGMEARQVHGVLLTHDGRVLIRIKNGQARLTGGHPEPGESWSDTLDREALEESSVVCGEMAYLGYQVPESEDYAQVRLVATIEEILPAQPDPDRSNNWIYGRELVPIAEAQKRLEASFGENGGRMLDLAVKIAEGHGWFTFKNSELEVLNSESKD